MLKANIRLQGKLPDFTATKEGLRKAGRSIVIKHALGATEAAYQMYPVGPPHKDGTPHTRDTFKIYVNGELVAEAGSFWSASDTEPPMGEGEFTVMLTAAGASFFLEFGTIFMDAIPILRTMVKQANFDISHDLRVINLSQLSKQ